MQIKKKKNTNKNKKTQQLRELKVLVRFSIENDSTLLITAGFVGKEKNVLLPCFSVINGRAEFRR